MDLHLTFANGAISGEGNDDVGRFIIRGRYDAGERECHWTKTYPGSHDVYYRGFREGKGIWGTWEIGLFSHGGFHIWPRALEAGEAVAKAAEAKAPTELVSESNSTVGGVGPITSARHHAPSAAARPARCPRWLSQAVLFAWSLPLAGLAAAGTREVPVPRSSHPGNIFLEGERVAVAVPADSGEVWRVWDYENRDVTTARAASGRLELGQLPVGYYRVGQDGNPAVEVTVGVLAPLRAPTPASSPVALDVAMAWFYGQDQMEAVANLCALAGINWVRDRLSWGQVERTEGEIDNISAYDASARAQAQAGLRVLQVNHISPPWANPNPKRFPLDLRDAYRFYQSMAERWAGKVLAFEPWNEADITMFGGHTGSEMASFQKAAYLGLKAGHPETIACLNVFALPNTNQLTDLHANEAWPYFDTFNFHHYQPVERYPAIYAHFRAVSAGRPVWVTECNQPVKWTDEKTKEPSTQDLRLQAERVAKVLASSVFEGAAASFYFLLPHYVEGQTQFGLLRPDLTPRPAYLALAAAGRLLADAKPIGRVSGLDPSIRALLFAAKPDGHAAHLLVAWTTGQEVPWSTLGKAERILDHLGRPRKPGPLTSAPLFALLPQSVAASLELLEPPLAPAFLEGRPWPVVLQATWPEERVVLNRSAYRVRTDQPERIPIWAYNFGAVPVEGHLAVGDPKGWQAQLDRPGRLAIAPGQRLELGLTVDGRQARSLRPAQVRLQGEFGPAGQPVLSLRLLADPAHVGWLPGKPIASATRAEAWQPRISGEGEMGVTGEAEQIIVTAKPGGSDRWVYPQLGLPELDQAEPRHEGLELRFTLLEGQGQVRVVFDEANGSSYVVDVEPRPTPGKPVRVLALAVNAVHGAGWSKPDPNQRLDLPQVRAIKIGMNTASERVKYAFSQPRWVGGP